MKGLERVLLVLLGLGLLLPAAGVLLALFVLGTCVVGGAPGFGPDWASFIGMAIAGLAIAVVFAWGGVALIRKADRMGREEPKP